MQSPVTADGATDGEKPAAVILDATGLRTPADLAARTTSSPRRSSGCAPPAGC